MTPDEENLTAAEKLLEAARRPNEGAAAGGRFVPWLSSGLGALTVIVTLCAILVGGFFFTIDRAEAKGEAGGLKGVDAAAVVQRNLDEHKQFENANHAWNQTMMLRVDSRLTDLSDGRYNRTLAPPPAPPPLYLPDGGLR